MPVFVAARVVQSAPDFLRQAAAQVAYAPWLVANIHIDRPLHDRPGAPPSWDNVVYRPLADRQSGDALGYVDATHQSLLPVPGATVLTHYRAFGDGAPGGALGPKAGRKHLLQTPWSAWRDQILADLSSPHPDVADKVTRIDITRYGHAMAMPLPQINGQVGLWPSSIVRKQLSKTEHYPARSVLAWEHMAFAHSDWAGYSVFEEAFTSGHSAGRVIG
jgi:hypothetical protein